MLSETVEKVFAKQDEKLVKQDQNLAEQRREFDARMKDTAKYHEQQLRENRSELLASRRWMIGTVITVGLSLAAYLSALIHFKRVQWRHYLTRYADSTSFAPLYINSYSLGS